MAEGGKEIVIAISGFGSFGAFVDNPSKRVVQRLQKEGIGDFVTNARLVCNVMEVAYGDVQAAVSQIWDTHNPDLVVHVGVHPVAGTIKLEQQSFGNGYCAFDVKWCVPRGNACPQMSDAVLTTGLDCSLIASNVSKELSDKRILIKTSEDPGRYLCGYCYYLSLNHDPKRSLFVHVPEFVGEVSEEIVTNALKHIIRESVSQLRVTASM